MKKLFLLLMLLTEFVFSQNISDDFFPLAVGNSWAYNYSTYSADFVNGFYHSDSGIATYSIISKIISNDSTIWNCLEIREIDNLKDTTEFSIVEYHSGNHRLVKYGDSNLFSVFPFTEEYQDSTSFFRYFPSVVLDTFSVNVKSINEYYNNYNVSFQRSVGLTKVSFYIYPPLVGYEASTNHTLQSAVITSVNNQDLESLPKDFELLQNYPNPFNPSTTIEYEIPNSSNVKIEIFDVLGRKIETLMNNEQTRGNYKIYFDGSNLSSGIYFYKITAGKFIQTKKMFLIK